MKKKMKKKKKKKQQQQQQKKKPQRRAVDPDGNPTKTKLLCREFQNKFVEM